MNRSTRLFTKKETEQILKNGKTLEDRAFFSTCYYCGNRIGETTHLRVRDITPEYLVKWDSKKKITKNIPISPDLHRLIQLYINEKKLRDHQHLFQRSHATYNRHLRHLCDELSIKANGFKIRIHSLRHSRCSHLDDVNLVHYLTNDSILTIYRTYRDLDFDSAKEKLMGMKDEHARVSSGEVK